MKPSYADIGSLALIVIAFAFGAAAYPHLPTLVASHWGANGAINGHMTRLWGVLLMPIIMAVLWGIFLVIPAIEPQRQNFETFRRRYDLFRVGILAFFLYVYVLTLAINLGYPFDLRQFLAPAMAALFAGVAAILKDSKRNFFVGIRTPWTLSSDVVWQKTHHLGAKLFYATALCTLVGALVPHLLLWYTFVPLLATVAITTVYSYVVYRCEKPHNK